MEMTVPMTVGQLREIKPRRYFIRPIDECDQAKQDYDYLFFKDRACMINRYSGESTEYFYENLWKNYAQGTESFPAELVVNAPIEAYRAWLYTKELIQ